MTEHPYNSKEHADLVYDVHESMLMIHGILRSFNGAVNSPLYTGTVGNIAIPDSMEEQTKVLIQIRDQLQSIGFTNGTVTSCPNPTTPFEKTFPEQFEPHYFFMMELGSEGLKKYHAWQS